MQDGLLTAACVDSGLVCVPTLSFSVAIARSTLPGLVLHSRLYYRLSFHSGQPRHCPASGVRNLGCASLSSDAIPDSSIPPRGFPSFQISRPPPCPPQPLSGFAFCSLHAPSQLSVLLGCFSLVGCAALSCMSCLRVESEPGPTCFLLPRPPACAASPSLRALVWSQVLLRKHSSGCLSGSVG